MRKSTDIIQVALILSAIDAALQAFAPFRLIGGGLPIVMGVSFAFLPALQAMGASGFSFGALLGGEIVGGAVAVLFGLAREQEVTNLVLFVGGRIASSADVMRRQAALQRVCPVGKIRLTAAQVVKSWAVSLFRLRGRCLNGVDPSFYASDAA